jgi:hypothetical protein
MRISPLIFLYEVRFLITSPVGGFIRNDNSFCSGEVEEEARPGEPPPYWKHFVVFY